MTGTNGINRTKIQKAQSKQGLRAGKKVASANERQKKTPIVIGGSKQNGPTAKCWVVETSDRQSHYDRQ